MGEEPSRKLTAVAVEERYEVGALVAVGGMADVYVGHDAVLDRRVAIKRLRGPMADPAAGERFAREARLLAGFSHPHAVALYDVSEDEHGPVLVMEYVEGVTLREYLRSRGEARLSAEEAAGLADQILAALAAAHARGIVHRDVKPGNVLVMPDGNVKLADFGIATMADLADVADLTLPGEVVGTPKYLSPEQVVGGRATPRSDVYAMGVLCFEMVCGHVPFVGDTPAATMAAHRSAPIPSLLDHCGDVPDWYVEVTERALAKDPRDRYPDAASMRTALRGAPRAVSTARMETLPLPVVVESDDAAAGWRGWWAVVAFVVVGLLIGAAVWALGERDGPTTVVPEPTVVTQPAPTLPPPTVAGTQVPVVSGGATPTGDAKDAEKAAEAAEKAAEKAVEDARKAAAKAAKDAEKAARDAARDAGTSKPAEEPKRGPSAGG